MYAKKVLVIIPLSLLFLLTTVTVLVACFGSSAPPTCARTIFLAKFSPGTIGLPAAGGAFTAPVGVVPFVSWDLGTGGCAVPTAATITMTLTCTPTAGGGPFTVGPQAFVAATPTVPGQQPVPGGTVSVSIPAGTPASTCAVSGTYTVTFGGGTNAGPLSATGDTQVCLVDPSPDNPNVPRLDLKMLTFGEDAGPVSLHQGDQTYVYFKFENNDLSHSATFNFKSEGRQVAGLPDGIDLNAAYSQGVYRISNTDADVFPSVIITDSAPLDRIPGDPSDPDPQRLTTSITLNPGGVGVIGIAQNNYGACADGSCNERSLCAEVTMMDQAGKQHSDHQEVCTGFVHVVDNTQPQQYPGFEVQDIFKAAPQADIFWSELSMRGPNGEPLEPPHFANRPPGSGNYTITTTGTDFQQSFSSPYPEFIQNQTTLPVFPSTIEYLTQIFNFPNNFTPDPTQVILENINPAAGPCQIPSFSLLDNQQNSIEVILLEGCGPNAPVDIRIDGDFFFAGTLQQLIENPPLGFGVYPESCRTIEFDGSSMTAPLITANPPSLAETVLRFSPIVSNTHAFTVTNQTGDFVDYTLTIDGPNGPPDGVEVNPTGTGTFEVVLDPEALSGDPLQTKDGWIEVDSPGALNRVYLPIIMRGEDASQPTPEVRVETTALVQDGYRVSASWADFADHPDTGEAACALTTNEPVTVNRLDTGGSFYFFNDKTGVLIPHLDARVNASSYWIFLGSLTNVDFELTVSDTQTGRTVNYGWNCGDRNTLDLGRATGSGLIVGEDGNIDVTDTDAFRQTIDFINTTSITGTLTFNLPTGTPLSIDAPLPEVVRGNVVVRGTPASGKDAQIDVVLDGSNCPTPCSGLVLAGGNSTVEGISFEGFPDYGLVLKDTDGNLVAESAFTGNGLGGLQISGSGGNLVGGTAEDANAFLNNGGPGITIESGTQNNLLFNTYTGNTGLAIDLGSDGVTDNDAGDADTGPNGLQNYPELTEALIGNSTVIDGTLAGMISAGYTLQFYASDACHASGYGEGGIVLGTTNVTADGTGTAAFSLTVDGTAAVGQFVTATATDNNGNTSEFSACFEVIGGVAAEAGPEVPTVFDLHQNYPNPFNPVTTIRYDVPKAGPVRIAVYDMLGRQVALLMDAVKAPGAHAVRFDAYRLPSGTYLYEMRGEGFRQTHTLVVIK